MVLFRVVTFQFYGFVAYLFFGFVVVLFDSLVVSLRARVRIRVRVRVGILACRCYRANNTYTCFDLQVLLDTKINHQTLMEKAEQEKYELVTRLLNAENDIMEVSEPIT